MTPNTITERLRGIVRIPVNDGAGLLDGKDFFERSFPTSNLAREAADEIERLTSALAWRAMGTAPRDGTRVNLCWEATAGFSAHVELGKWSGSLGWTNTYGKPFSGEPDCWQPLPEPPALPRQERMAGEE